MHGCHRPYRRPAFRLYFYSGMRSVAIPPTRLLLSPVLYQAWIGHGLRPQFQTTEAQGQVWFVLSSSDLSRAAAPLLPWCCPRSRCRPAATAKPHGSPPRGGPHQAGQPPPGPLKHPRSKRYVVISGSCHVVSGPSTARCPFRATPFQPCVWHSLLVNMYSPSV